MKIPFTMLAALGSTAKQALETGTAEYARITKAGQAPSPGQIVVVVLAATKNWKPEHKGKQLLTPGLRAKLADALGGLAYNFAAAEEGKPLA